LLPSLHAWLWLPQMRDRPLAARLATWLAGLAGPVLLVWEFAVRFGLGLDAPWYLLQLAAIGWVPFPLLALVVLWAAAAAHLAARHEHQGVGRRGPRDHVGLLAAERLEQHAFRIDPYPRTQELVALRIAANGPRELSEHEGRPRLARSLKREHRRAHEELEAD